MKNELFRSRKNISEKNERYFSALCPENADIYETSFSNGRRRLKERKEPERKQTNKLHRTLGRSLAVPFYLFLTILSEDRKHSSNGERLQGRDTTKVRGWIERHYGVRYVVFKSGGSYYPTSKTDLIGMNGKTTNFLKVWRRETIIQVYSAANKQKSTERKAASEGHRRFN
jgi:hypothetical protein